ncbi:MAG TPA: hypothetical protein VHU91_06605 [Mycobacteriales bacterium]|jgi:hypothetical protein|nr:hypothetical protein [Mycobacteriales bacterium]
MLLDATPTLARVTLSATLTAWLRAWRAGLAEQGEVIAHVEASVSELTGHDHVVRQPAEDERSEEHAEPLELMLEAWGSAGVEDIRLVLPTPGDTRGLPAYSAAAPPETGNFVTAAVDAGCAVICAIGGIAPGPDLRSPGHVTDDEARLVGLIPEPIPGRMVAWRRYELTAAAEPVPTARDLPSWATPPLDAINPADAGAALVDELHDVTDLLGRLELAPSEPVQAERLAALRRQGIPGAQLPPGYSQRNRLRLARAGMVLGIAELAQQDSFGGAIDSHQALARTAALRSIANAARRSYTAAINAPLESATAAQPTIALQR